jgi:hypothetical protein
MDDQRKPAKEYAVCPFYVEPKSVYSKDNFICCKCTIPTASGSRLIFPSRKEKDEHLKLYCECQYRRCEQYLSIMHWQWPEEE